MTIIYIYHDKITIYILFYNDVFDSRGVCFSVEYWLNSILSTYQLIWLLSYTTNRC